METTTPPPTKTLPPTTPPFPIDGRLCPLVIVLMIVIAAAIGIKKITSENGKGPEGGNGKGPERKKRPITSRWPREWLTEKRIAGFWVYPYLWTIQNTHYVTIVIVKGEDTDKKKEPILGETVNVVLFDEEDHPLHLLSRPGGGALPEFGGSSISVNAHFQFTVSAQPLKLMAVTVRDDVKIFDVRETTKAKERKEFPKKPTKWKCCVKAFDVPANRSGRKLKKGRLYESFHMNVDFNDKGKCQSRSCEFRQYIRGTFTLDGVAAIHQLPDGPLDPVIWCEDGIPHHFRKGHHMFYGHRDNPDTYADKYNPERATGHEYRGSDSPMMNDPDPAVTMVMNLEFRGEIIDVASGKAIRTTRWKVNHSGR